MRKLLSIVLCLVMVFCFAVPAMAVTNEVDMKDDTTTTSVDSESVQTTVKVVVNTENPVYKVTVEWENPLVFEYNFGTWNTTTLVYDKGWDGSQVREITLTNYSNAQVKAVPSIVDSEDGVTFETSVDSLILANADTTNGAGKGSPDEKTFTLSVAGAPTDKSITVIEETLTIILSKYTA